MKINLGASRHWVKENWAVLDHRVEKSQGFQIAGDIAAMQLESGSCDLVFLSHVIEHIPHLKIQSVMMEINRVMKIGATVRILVPDLFRLAQAYVRNDTEYFAEARAEDESIRQDLGIGGSFMNFMVSPGQDTILLDRSLSYFIAGYAHLYAYDATMMRLMLENYGFGDVRQRGFCESEHPDFQEPLHVVGLPAQWASFNQKFYRENGLIHRQHKGEYEINFKVTGFDKNPLTSLIVEARKVSEFTLSAENDMNGEQARNYNHYGLSMLHNSSFRGKLDVLTRVSKKMSHPGFLEKLMDLLGHD